MPHIRNLLKGKTTWLVLALIYTCTITVLFFLPGRDLPRLQLPAIDKIAHALMFFLLGVLWIGYLFKTGNFTLDRNNSTILLLAALLYGIIIEILQGQFALSRSADFYDLLANLVGAVAAIILSKRLWSTTNRQKN